LRFRLIGQSLTVLHLTCAVRKKRKKKIMLLNTNKRKKKSKNKIMLLNTNKRKMFEKDKKIVYRQRSLQQEIG